MIFVDRVGFPIMAFLIMAYMCFVTLNKVTVAIDNNSERMVEAIGANTSILNLLRHEIVRRESP